MKKVLMVATYFPPAGGVGTFRITKFAKYLQKFGWEPVVLTVSEECYSECNFIIDESLLKDIPNNVSIYRTGISKKPIILKYLFSDLSTRWLHPLFLNIKSVIKKEKPDLLYATGDPFYPLLVAPFAKFFYDLNYVVDLRDPWKLALPENNLKSRLKKPINNILEPIVIKNASKIIIVSEKMGQEYRAEYSNRPPGDFIVIPNGYDPDDYRSIPKVNFSKFTILYAGKFLAGKSFRNPIFFLQALKLLRERNIQVFFKHIGEINRDVIKMVNELEISDQFEALGQLSYYETISYMKGASLLLLIGNGQQTEQTGKIFDYLGCNRPLLALAPRNGGIANVVNDLDQVVLIENEDPQKIAQAISNIYLDGYSINPKMKILTKYLRENLTSELSNVFNEIVR